MIAVVFVVVVEGGDGGLDLAGQEVAFQQDAVLRGCQRSVLLWVCGCFGAQRMWVKPLSQLPGEIARDVGRAIITEQTGG